MVNLPLNFFILLARGRNVSHLASHEQRGEGQAFGDERPDCVRVNILFPTVIFIKFFF